MTERAGPVPPWVQVTAALRERILSGELAPGAMVPSIVALHQEYGIAEDDRPEGPRRAAG